MNGTDAYMVVYPKSSRESARRDASRLLTNADIQAEIQARLAEKKMSADEVLIRLANMARADIADFIVNHPVDYDFFLRTKVPKNSRLIGDWGYEEEPLQNVTRYYVSNEGCELFKIMPPLARAKDPTKERRMAVSKGCKVTVMNKLEPLDRSTINYDWYIDQTVKLINFEGEYEDAETELFVS